MRAVAAVEFHAQIEGCLRAQAQRSCERGERGDGALTKLPCATGIMNQVHDVCARRAAEGVCKSAWLPRVGLRRRRVLLWTGQCAREDHAARTIICTAMQHPEIATALATASQEQTFRAQGVPCKACLPTRRFAGKAVRVGTQGKA